MTVATLEGIDKLRRDLREAAGGLGHREARFLCDAYYMLQEHRIQAANQVRALNEADEPNAVIGWLLDQHATLENEIRKALVPYTDAHVAGRWARSITGIGPVLAAGLLAHIDIERSETVGQIWRFAGLDPSVKWERGQKRPWNADLKVLCWKCGESFVKVSGRESDIYGKVYLARKALEEERNAAGLFADQAKHALETKKYGKTTEAYKAYIEGRLPQARIHARAKRYSVKIFLSHLHAVMFRDRFGMMEPLPYILIQPGHVHLIEPPNLPDGFASLPSFSVARFRELAGREARVTSEP